MKQGDIVTEEPPVGALVRDKDGDHWEHIDTAADGWQDRSGDRLAWSGLLRYGPLTLLSLPEPSDPLAGITQEKLDAHLASRLADLRVAQALAEGARRAANATEEAADNAERAIRGSEINLMQFLDAARAKLPHLQVPTFEDATKDLEGYR